MTAAANPHHGARQHGGKCFPRGGFRKVVRRIGGVAKVTGRTLDWNGVEVGLDPVKPGAINGALVDLMTDSAGGILNGVVEPGRFLELAEEITGRIDHAAPDDLASSPNTRAPVAIRAGKAPLGILLEMERCAIQRWSHPTEIKFGLVQRTAIGEMAGNTELPV